MLPNRLAGAIAAAPFIAALAAFTPHAAGAAPSWSFPSITNSNFSAGASVNGLEFTPSVNILVTQLGYLDDNVFSADGLARSHQVGIFDTTTGQLVLSAIVPAGAAAPRSGFFRYVSVPRTELRSNRLYIIAAIDQDDGAPNVPLANISAAQEITVGRWIGGGADLTRIPNFVISTPNRRMNCSFQFELAQGCVADVDDGSRTGTRDNAVTLDDLLYFLERYSSGC